MKTRLLVELILNHSEQKGTTRVQLRLMTSHIIYQQGTLRLLSIRGNNKDLGLEQCIIKMVHRHLLCRN